MLYLSPISIPVFVRSKYLWFDLVVKYWAYNRSKTQTSKICFRLSAESGWSFIFSNKVIILWCKTSKLFFIPVFLQLSITYNLWSDNAIWICFPFFKHKGIRYDIINWREPVQGDSIRIFNGDISETACTRTWENNLKIKSFKNIFKILISR